MSSAGKVDLLVRLVVHQHEVGPVLVEELHVLGLGRDARQLLTGTERLFDHRAVGQVLELGSHERPALAGLDVLELDDGVEHPVDLDDIAVLQLIG